MKLWRHRKEAVSEAIVEVSTEDVFLSQMQTALNALPIGVIIYDSNGQERWLNLAGKIMIDQQRGHTQMTQAMSLMSGEAVNGHTSNMLVDIDGPPEQTLEISSVSLADDGALLMIEDIHEKIITDRVRTDFVANISYELRTPVGVLAVLAETIAREIDKADPDITGLARSVVQESHRVSRIIDDLLELAKIEFDGAQLQEQVSIEVIISEAIERVRAVATSNNILITSTQIDEKIVLEGDGRQLVSAVANLCENAVTHSTSGKQVHVGVTIERGFAIISVIDQGVGIEPNHLDRVFERFYRVDQVRSRQTGGTGLGLAIVRNVAANHGGEVNVVSTPGEGSTFSLRLPLRRR